MDKSIKYNDWIESMQSHGKYSFSTDYMEKQLSGFSHIALKRALNRLSVKNKILSVFRGFYIIIPVEYSRRGIMPAELFIDSLMRSLQRPYYVGLLSAAAMHGAGHQQPQEFYVFTLFPQIRKTRKKDLIINYIAIEDLPIEGTEQKKTDTGYLQVSGPLLTASDLIQYEKRIGGINRAAIVIQELCEEIKPNMITRNFILHVPVTVLQRLGYLFEFVCRRSELADEVFNGILSSGKKMFRCPLKTSVKTVGFSSVNRWKIIENIQVETDI